MKAKGRVHSPEPQHRSVVNGRCCLTVAATAKLMRQGPPRPSTHTPAALGAQSALLCKALTFSIRIFRNHSAHVTTWVPEPAVCRGLRTAPLPGWWAAPPPRPRPRLLSPPRRLPPPLWSPHLPALRPLLTPHPWVDGPRGSGAVEPLGALALPPHRLCPSRPPSRWCSSSPLSRPALSPLPVRPHRRPTCTCLCPRPACCVFASSLGAPTVIPPLLPARVPPTLQSERLLPFRGSHRPAPLTTPGSGLSLV